VQAEETQVAQVVLVRSALVWKLLEVFAHA
jgi:hypothetical protein